MDLIASCLADLSVESLQNAIARYLTESEEPWFPMPGLLRRYAAEYHEGTLPPWEPVWERIIEATDAWSQHDREKALAARAMLGEELMTYVKSLGGFYNLASASSEQLTVMQSNFRNAWTKQQSQAETLRKLPECLRPKMALPGAVRKSLGTFGELPKISEPPADWGDV